MSDFSTSKFSSPSTDASPYAAPKSELNHQNSHSSSAFYAHKKNVIFKPETPWPSRCFKCNKETSRKKKLTLVYVNPWVYLTLFIWFVITIILSLFVQKKFKIELPVCDVHIKKRRRFLLMQWSLLLLALAVFAAGIHYMNDIVIALAIALVLVVVIAAIFGRMVVATKFKDEQLWVRGTGKEFRASLPEKPQKAQAG